MKKKLKCKDCTQTCCDNITLKRCEGNVNGPIPDDLPKGSWIYAGGIYWVKKANGKWKCRAYDSKNKLCTIYAHRPPICRWFRCPSAKKNKNIKMPSNSFLLYSTQYEIYLFAPKI